MNMTCHQIGFYYDILQKIGIHAAKLLRTNKIAMQNLTIKMFVSVLPTIISLNFSTSFGKRTEHCQCEVTCQLGNAYICKIFHFGKLSLETIVSSSERAKIFYIFLCMLTNSASFPFCCPPILLCLISVSRKPSVAFSSFICFNTFSVCHSNLFTCAQ